MRASAFDKKDAWDPAFWAGKRALVTGHTGFKGAWLALWLARMGARVTGFSLPSPERESLVWSEIAPLARQLGVQDLRGDIQSPVDLASALAASAPEVVFHLAAQAIVLDSYTDPIKTWGVNVMGSLALLQALGAQKRACAFVGVTSDKCYENKEWQWGYRETDPLGGADPYSASKAACEIMLSSWRASYSEKTQVRVASARAGNVIGGGDNAPHRVVPDLLNAFSSGSPALIRNPLSTRPYQHVLEPLSGYLLLARGLIERPGLFEQAYNFGPESDGEKETLWLALAARDAWGEGASVISPERPPALHEAAALMLDSSKAKKELGWRSTWSAKGAIEAAVAWECERLNLNGLRETERQIDLYQAQLPFTLS